MNVCLVSSFRNAAGYVERYVMQAALLSLLMSAQGHRLTCVWGEGDSTDGTRAALESALVLAGVKAEIVDVHHGGPVYGSVVDAQRFRQLAHVGNRMWAAIPAETDAILFVESDLVWMASTLVRLVEHLAEYPVIAPMVYRRAAFYDTWAAWKDGVQFRGHRPYHKALRGHMGEIVQVDSMGSCLAMRADVGRGLTWPEADVVKGLCRQVYAAGASVWLHTGLAVQHE